MRIITPKVRHTIIHNFLGGISWAIGLTLGVSILVYLLSVTASTLGALPLIGSWLAQIIEATLQSLRPN